MASIPQAKPEAGVFIFKTVAYIVNIDELSQEDLVPLLLLAMCRLSEFLQVPGILNPLLVVHLSHLIATHRRSEGKYYYFLL